MLKDLRIVKGLSTLLGLIYAIFIGILGFSFPQNLQLTIFGIGYISIIFYLSWRVKLKLNSIFYFLAGGGILLSIYSAVTTGPLLVPVNIFTLLFILSMLTMFVYKGSLPSSAADYVSSLLSFIKEGGKNLFNSDLIKAFFRFTKTPSLSVKPKTSRVLGIFLAFPVLLIFHILFSMVNSQYSLFMNQIFEIIWEVIKFILDIEIFWILIKAIFNSYLFFVILSTTSNIQFERKPDGRTSEILGVTVFLSVILFAIFSFFQTQLLFVNYSSLPFKELSLYTQQGFWELVAISIFGYALFLPAANNIKKDLTINQKLLTLLSIFIAELILITIFSYHKLITLQNIFGFKDQRILAFTAVTLIFITFVLAAGRIWGKVTSKTIFLIQGGLLVLFVSILNVVNIDLFVSRINPISYYVDNVKYKDYSYLLGNSYDNHGVWLSLINEMNQKGIVHPKEEYYWGWYSSLCKPSYSFSPTRFSDVDYRSGQTVTYLVDHWETLYKKYESDNKNPKLNDLSEFNWNEYQAYQLIKGNEAIFKNMVTQIQVSCRREFNLPTP